MQKLVGQTAMRWLAAFLLVCGASSLYAEDAPFLWRVEGGVDHYLMGSVHVLPPSAYPLPEALERAYAETRALMLETDMTALNAPEMQLSILASGMSTRGLAAEVGEALHARVREALGGSGLPEILCDSFRAWMCAVTLSVQSFISEGMDPNLGLDQHFATRARADGRELIALEAVEAQLEIISGMPPVLAKRFLESSLADLDDPALQPQAMIASWRGNDVATMTRVVNDMRNEYPMLYQRLLAQRNRAWMHSLRQHLTATTPTLVIVGAAHLVGPDGLVDALRADGFSVIAVSK